MCKHVSIPSGIREQKHYEFTIVTKGANRLTRFLCFLLIPGFVQSAPQKWSSHAEPTSGNINHDRMCIYMFVLMKFLHFSDIYPTNHSDIIQCHNCNSISKFHFPARKMEDLPLNRASSRPIVLALLMEDLPITATSGF